jgi:hypothetical protein
MDRNDSESRPIPVLVVVVSRAHSCRRNRQAGLRRCANFEDILRASDRPKDNMIETVGKAAPITFCCIITALALQWIAREDCVQLFVGAADRCAW